MHASRARWVILFGCFFSLGVGEVPFIGAERCQLCHRSIDALWKATPHGRATASLDEETETPSCLPCHTTGPANLPGVQCEACHGAGGNYWPAEIMIDAGKAREAGLVTPNEATCRRCHGSGLPGHADRFEMPQDADRRRTIH
ncbi:MAG: multiheme c-type cytochrome [Vicinamibacteria bacterium]